MVISASSPFQLVSGYPHISGTQQGPQVPVFSVRGQTAAFDTDEAMQRSP